MIEPGTLDSALMALVRAIAADDAATALRLLNVSPALASPRFNEGATRQAAKAHYLDEIERYIYAGDTALHMAAAAYRTEIVPKQIAMGADVRARNRRGAEPLHAAAVGMPGSRMWNPHAQARPSHVSLGRAPIQIPSTTAGWRRCTEPCARVAPQPSEPFSIVAPISDARTRAARRQCCSRPRTRVAAAPARQRRKCSKIKSSACSSNMTWLNNPSGIAVFCTKNQTDDSRHRPSVEIASSPRSSQ